jgi:hypothetical protein
VPAQQIAQNLAFINWTVLAAISLGAFAAVLLIRTRADATRGFLAFTAFCSIGFGLLALASDLALPETLPGSPITVDPAFDGPRRVALGLFCLLAAVYLVAIVRRRPARLVGTAAFAAGVATMGLGALAWGGGVLHAVPLFLQLAILSAATGGVFAGMVLGHWYLVTPKLSERPLILLSRALTAVIAMQLALFWAWVATGAGPGGAEPFAILTGPWALFVWLRLLVGLVFPLVVAWAAIQTARSRSMESATGLLYIGVGAVASGTILASGLYFGAGLLV